MTNIGVHSTACLPERQRRALALLASMACPSTEWPRALLLIGLASVEAALSPDRKVGVFWCGAGEIDGLLNSPVFHGYIPESTPIIVLFRSFSDAEQVRAAIGGGSRMTKRITQLRARAAAAGVTLRVFRRRDYHVDGKPVRYGIVDPYGELFFSTLSEVHERISRYERNKRAGLPPVHVLAQAEPTR